MEETDIGLQELIYQVKRELLEPNAAQRAKDPYPLFGIDKIELEIAVKVTRDVSNNVKLSVLSVAEVGGSANIGHEKGTVVRVSLTPLLPLQELADAALREQGVRAVVAQISQEALIKSPLSLSSESERTSSTEASEATT